jgi:transcriptional regulator with XRE-family HTH domain
VSTFGQIVAGARKALGISQKDLAGKIRKEDGVAISPQYLNDLEHDRRNPPSEFIIEQFATELQLPKQHLVASSGIMPSQALNDMRGADPKKVEEAFRAFRKTLKGKS